MAKTDYAANGGLYYLADEGPPRNCLVRYSNCDWEIAFPFLQNVFTGVAGQLSEIKPAQITDGTSHTLMRAEKYLNPVNYETGKCGGDNNSAYQGHDRDTVRWIPELEQPHKFPEFVPLADTSKVDVEWSHRFGSAHAAALNAGLVDSSVRSIHYDIDADVYHALGVRDDGLVFNE